jgi:hypothetical protein
VAKKKSTTNRAVISVVLDKSGSMQPLTADTIGSYNRFVIEQGGVAPNARFFLTLFDSEVRQPYSDMTVSEVPTLDTRTYRPSGNTALYDAIGRAVHDLDDLAEKPDKVVLVILTDGQENSSREFDRERILRLLSDRQEKHDWQVVYLGANQNSFAESAKIGIRRGSTSDWAYSGAGVQNVMAATSTATADYLSGASRTVDMSGLPKTQVNNNVATNANEPIKTTTPNS